MVPHSLCGIAAPEPHSDSVDCVRERGHAGEHRGYRPKTNEAVFWEGTPIYGGGLAMEKTLHNSDVSGTRTNVPDLVVVGNGDLFKLLCKASSQAEGWMKSTKAMEVPGGCVVQVTTQQRNIDGTYAVAEALTFVPGVSVVDDVNGGRKLDVT